MKPIPWPLDNEVHLYRMVQPHDPSELARLGRLLDQSENGRAALLKCERARQRTIAGRGMLREILGGYLGIEANAVQLAAGGHGKPFLVAAKARLCFNLAHSGDDFLLVVAANREVGVDIETIDPGKPLSQMAGMVFSRQEQEQWSALASPRREEAFYRVWVRKEACLKACGRGFSLPANSVEISPAHEPTAAMMARCEQRNWHVLDIDVPAPCCAALAVEICGSIQSCPVLVHADYSGQRVRR